MRRFALGLFALAVALIVPQPLWAADEGGADKPAAYAKFVTGLTPQRGLFTLWRGGDGKLYLEIAKAQLSTDFIMSPVPGSGLGGFGVTPGLPYIAFARIVRFTRDDNKISFTWPNTSFLAPDGSPAALAVAQNFAPSVIAVAPIVAEDAASGAVVIDASPFLGDIIDMQNYLRAVLDTDKSPGGAYRLDPSRSFFGPSKAFPENVILEADQTFASAEPAVIDNVPDARTVQIRIKYNIAKAPDAGSYTPRLSDDRVGFYPNIMLNFGTDRVEERQVRYILRWNVARHPLVYYISNTIPREYRDTIKAALLTWNDAFAKIGIQNAVQVRDQPDDPSFDEDDIRYNTVHWLTLSNSGGYAQAGVVFDPRTGELIKTSIVIDSDLVRFGYLEGRDFTIPGADEPAGFLHEAGYAREAHASAAFGLWSLRAMGAAPWDGVPDAYVQDFLRSIVLHESGHNWGLQHNFIASEAYSPKELQSKAFTARNGITNSVMEYTPINLWPKGTPNGDYFQVVLGPYDYYAIKWGYAPVPGAHTPQDEVPTLQRWASVWSDPRYRYMNDEDVAWGSGHAIDPRVNQNDLSNDNLSWCRGQMAIADGLLNGLDRRYDVAGSTHDAQRTAFSLALSPYVRCASVAWHYVGGEYLSRAHVGDPHAASPLAPVPAGESKRAFDLLDRYVLSDRAWHFSPHLLRQLVYTEWVTDFPQAAWQYDPPDRHDVPVARIAGIVQQRVLTAMFAPALLQRIDDLSLKYGPRATMSLGDLFAWSHHAVFADLGRAARSSDPIHRSLQQWYARKLALLLLAPARGTPYDAQSLARADLTVLRTEVARAAKLPARDALDRAHLAALANVADQALNARTVVPVEAAR
jgi:Met-zincin/Domain of unknown function (DUF5117)